MQNHIIQTARTAGPPPRAGSGIVPKGPGRASAALWMALIGSLGLILAASVTRADEPLSYSGTVEPCLSPHGDKDRYREGLLSVGWALIPDTERAAALSKLADAFLPATGQIDASWPDHLAYRAQANSFWADLSKNRILLTREDQVLLLAGFATPMGEMVVECWVAGPLTAATDDFLALAGTAYQGQGVVMTQLNLPAAADAPRTEIFVSRLTPPMPIDPPLAATDGLRTRITFQLPQQTL